MGKNQRKYESHNLRRSSAYAVWSSMKDRCGNKNNPAFRNYGERGITVCERWLRFSNFIFDMGHPEKGMTIERVDNNKGYSPDNCIWADRKEQGNNKRNNIILTVDGFSATLSDWAKKSGIKYGTLHQRILKGWADHDVVNTPIVKERMGVKRGDQIHKAKAICISYLGKEMALGSAAKLAGIKTSTVKSRIDRGWPLDIALSERTHKGPHSFGANHNVVFKDTEMKFNG